MTASTKRGSYPHPVLDVTDDVASYFDVSNADVSPTVEDVELRFDVRSNDPTLKQLIDAGRARLSLRWRCSATLATGEGDPEISMALSDGHQYKFWLDQKQVRGPVIVDIRVVVVHPLTNFRWERQHSDYGSATFDLVVGDIVADGGSFTFDAKKLYDPLDPPIGSCFRFVADPKLRQGILVSFLEDDVIQVLLPSVAYQNLGLLAARPELQITSVVLPALIQTISFVKQELKEPSGEWDDREGWFRVITDKVNSLGGFEAPEIELAQRILNYPVEQTLAIEAGVEEDGE